MTDTLILIAFIVTIPSLALATIINRGVVVERLMWCIKRQDKRMESVLTDYMRCAQERNRLFNLVYWAIGTTEMAISEIQDDEEDTADAKEKLREMKIAVGMDPDLDSMEQDPAVMNGIELIKLRRQTR